MDAVEKITVDHKEIKKWIISHKGKPAKIEDPQAKADYPGLRVDFPGKEDEAFLSYSKSSRTVSWEEFFKIFDEENLAFIYLQKPTTKDMTMAYRFISRDALNEYSLNSTSF